MQSKMSPPQVEITVDQQLEGGKCTYGGDHQFLMNNSSDNIVWQFSHGGVNGAVHLLIESVVVGLFKFKGKMSATPQVEITVDQHLEGGKCTDGGHQQFLMNNSSNNTVCLFKRCGVNGKLNLFTRCVVVELFKFKGKMSAVQIRCRSPSGGGKMNRWCTPPTLMNDSRNNVVW